MDGSGERTPTEENTGVGEPISLGELQAEIMLLQSVAVLEISCGGAQIETTSPLAVDSLHAFRLARGDQSALLNGRVAHCRTVKADREPMTYRAGIEFIDPPERVQSLIRQFIEERL